MSLSQVSFAFASLTIRQRKERFPVIAFAYKKSDPIFLAQTLTVFDTLIITNIDYYREMPRLKSVRGPKRLSKNVIIAQEYHRQDVNKLLITIKLPPEKLKHANEKQDTSAPNSILQSVSIPGLDSNTTDYQQNEDATDLLNIFDFDAGEFEELETALNLALNQPHTDLLRSSGNRGMDIVEALKASPKRKALTGEGSEKPKVQPEKAPPQPATPVKRRKPNKTSSRLPRKSADNYRPIPANIVPILESELRGLEDEDEDDDTPQIEVVGFSLKDPLGGSKIKLPVKSRFCSHFECFDYENFCLFHKIPTSIKDMTRKRLIQNNFNELARRKNSTQSSSQESQSQTAHQTTYQQIMPCLTNFGVNYNSPMVIQQLKLSPYVKIVDNPLPGDSYTSKFVTPGYQSCPFYSCPVCDTKFPLNALLISDAFNYFVKITSLLAERIELIGLQKYRAIGETDPILKAANTNDENVFVLSSDDEEEEKIRQESATKQKMKLGNFINRSAPPPPPPDWFAPPYNRTNHDTDLNDQGNSREDPIVLD